ncbi:MAG: response regulator [Bacteroidales bacterium]|nr:response regulator [Bacteroidales bacterium]
MDDFSNAPSGMVDEKDMILYIDDEPENLSGFKYIYRKFYNIHLAGNAKEGMEILRQYPIKVVITDQRMPGLSGVEFLEMTLKEFPEISRIILTGYSDMDAIIQAINKGRIYRYITKPWDKDELKISIDNAINSYNLRIENKILIESLKRANKELEETNKNLEIKIEERTTEIIRKNAELEKHRNHLENLVEERTRDLIKAKEKAEESDNLKSAFLANLSHELRTPMNAIIGFSNLLNDDDLDSTQKKEYIDIIDQNGVALVKLIDDIIDISQIEANQLVINNKPFSISQLIKDLYTFYERQRIHLDKNNIEFSYLIPENCENLQITSDHLRLRQILINLLDNAFKFTKEGKITFGFDLITNNLSKSLLFFVVDTGIGIEKENHELIFTRFRKVQSNDDKVLYGGSGLGLAICKSLVELMDGEISLASIPGKGSRFTFSIPLEKSGSKPISIFNDKQSLTSNSPNWKGRNIIVAEDEETNFKFIEAALKRTEVNLLRAMNGKEVLKLCDDTPKIDVILMDIRMPEMDGYEATRKIKKLNKNIPIIAQTAYARENERKEVFEVGCDDYIAKPYKAEELLQIINKFFLP